MRDRHRHRDPERATTRGERVTIQRGRAVYATGVSVRLRSGATQLVLDRLRPMRAGDYTLVARKHQGRDASPRRTRITITS